MSNTAKTGAKSLFRLIWARNGAYLFKILIGTSMASKLLKSAVVLVLAVPVALILGLGVLGLFSGGSGLLVGLLLLIVGGGSAYFLDKYYKKE